MQIHSHQTVRGKTAPRGSVIRLSLALAVLSSACTAQAGKLGVFTSDEKGFDTHTFYYDDGKEVVLFDTQFVPALTEKMVQQIRRETHSPITRVVVTHPNPDKFNGLAYLHGLGVKSISSAAVADDIPAVHAYKTNFWVNTMKAFKPGDYPRLENVQERFNGASTTLRLASGETLSLFALKNPGVASHQVVARIDATGDLIVGDLVHHQAHAWLEGGLVNGRPSPSLESWITAVGELPGLTTGHPKARVYGGRGEFALVLDAVRQQQDYLRGAARITQAHVSERHLCKSPAGSGAQVAPVTDAKDHAALEQKLAAAFPAYRLPYMVRYSVYGLADAMARQACTSEAKTVAKKP